MKGTAKKIIDQIIQSEGGDDEFQRLMVKSKLVIKGVLVDKYTDQTQDDPQTIEQLRAVAAEFNVNV